jgi:hypothetical protein
VCCICWPPLQQADATWEGWPSLTSLKLPQGKQQVETCQHAAGNTVSLASTASECSMLDNWRLNPPMAGLAHLSNGGEGHPERYLLQVGGRDTALRCRHVSLSLMQTHGDSAQ